MNALRDFLTHVRFTLRLFHKNAGFSLVVIGSIALGIGASSAIFSLVYAVLLDPYPYRDSDRMIAPAFSNERGNQGSMRYTVQDLFDLQRDSKTLEDAFLADSREFVMTDGLAERVRGMAYSPNFFEFMGVPAMVGRTWGPGDIPSPAAPPQIAVLSYLFWQRRFNGDPDIAGKTIELNRQPYTILGVVPPRFTWNDAEVYVPLPMVTGPKTLAMLARMKPGLSLQAAGAELQAMTERFAGRNPDAYAKDFRMQPERLNDWLLGRFQGTLLILMAAVGFLLLIACGNVSILLLARASTREQEIAVRVSLGASHGRVIRQLLTESVLLSVTGGLLGVLMAYRGVPAIVALMPEYSVPHEAVIAVNGTVVLVSFAVSVLSGILFGMAPALQLAKTEIREIMDEGGRSRSGSGRIGRVRGMLIVSEVALTMILLVGAGVAIRSFVTLIDTPLGYNPRNVAWLSVSTLEGKYSTWQTRRAYFDSILEKLRTTPGVESAAATVTATPPWIGFETPFEISGQPGPDPNQLTLVGLVGGDYFSTIHIPLLRGRQFSDVDFAQVRRVAIINQEMQDLYFQNEDPAGRLIRIPGLNFPGNPSLLTAPAAEEWIEVIGVVASTRNRGLTENPKPAIYLPYGLVLPPNCAYLVRTTGDPSSMFNSLRQQVVSVDADQPVAQIRTLERVLDRSAHAYPRFSTTLFSIFAVVGLCLAATGLFSVVSYTSSRRTHEFGIRVALGARPADILGLVAGSTAKLMLAGIAIGLAASYALSGLISRYVQGWDPADPTAFAAVTLVLLAVAFAACWWPARRATAIEPVAALRHE